jgi:hypothetical protein
LPDDDHHILLSLHCGVAAVVVDFDDDTDYQLMWLVLLIAALVLVVADVMQWTAVEVDVQQVPQEIANPLLVPMWSHMQMPTDDLMM